MRTHILLLALATLFGLSACASHDDKKVSKAEQKEQEQVHYSMIDGAAGRIR